MCAQTFRGGARRAAANAIRVDNADIRVKPLLTVAFHLPQTVQE